MSYFKETTKMSLVAAAALAAMTMLEVNAVSAQDDGADAEADVADSEAHVASDEDVVVYAGNNNNAWVEGAAARQGTGDKSACPAGFHCVWSQPNYRGKMFLMFYCGTYAMHGWNGIGSDYNNQSGAVMKYLKKDGSEGGRRNPQTGGAQLDMTPFWFIRPC